MGNPAGGFFFNPFDFAVKGIANTSVLAFGGKLLALYEVWTCLMYTCAVCTYVVSTSVWHRAANCVSRTVCRTRLIHLALQISAGYLLIRYPVV